MRGMHETCAGSPRWSHRTNLASMALLVAVTLVGRPTAAAEPPPLRFDPSVLDRAEQYLASARQAAEAIDLEPLGDLTPEVEERVEFGRRAIVEHEKQGRVLIEILRNGRSLATAFLLSQLVWNVEELLGDLGAQLFEVAKQVGERREAPDSPGEQAADAISRLEASGKARGWAIDVFGARMPLGSLPGAVSAAALDNARAADLALDECSP